MYVFLPVVEQAQGLGLDGVRLGLCSRLPCKDSEFRQTSGDGNPGLGARK